MGRSSRKRLRDNCSVRIVITGVTGFRNRGVEALVVPTVRTLCGVFPGVEITVLTWSPDYDSTRFPHPQVRFVQDRLILGDNQARPWRLAARKIKAGLRHLCRPKTISPVPFQRPDLILATGGDVFSSEYGIASLRHHLWPLEWAAQADVPIVMLAQSITPFKEQIEAELWLGVAKRARLITIREPLSYAYVTKELGLPEHLIHLTADPAFLLEPEPIVGDRLRAQICNRDERPVVAVAMSQGICKWTGADYAEHSAAWVRVIQMMLREWNAHVLCVPHVQESYGDDRILATRVFRELGFDDRVHLAAGDFSAAEYKAMISRCDLVVAERMHAAIAGLSTGVCTVAIEYSVKARGIIQALVGNEFGEAGCIMSMPQFLDHSCASAKLRRVWSDRTAVVQHLRQVLPAAFSASSRNFQLIRGAFHP